MKTKNADYTAGSKDPFANFRNSEIVGVKAELGILVRVVDKIKRLQTFIQTGNLSVANESFEDSLVDIINYMVLLAGLASDNEQFNCFAITKPEIIAEGRPVQIGGSYTRPSFSVPIDHI